MASAHLEQPTEEKQLPPNLRRPGNVLDGNGHIKPRPDDVQGKPNSKSVEATLDASDIYSENIEFAAGTAKALLSAQLRYARGLHDMQRGYLDLIHRSIELMQRTTRELIRCTSASEVAELQRDALQGGMDQMFEGSAKIFRVSSQAINEAVRSIEGQIQRS